jgi:hypothetical protein
VLCERIAMKDDNILLCAAGDSTGDPMLLVLLNIRLFCEFLFFVNVFLYVFRPSFYTPDVIGVQ